jgi:endonuclease/exonuclease/phosphatase family metal-dependent hydrolase
MPLTIATYNLLDLFDPADGEKVGALAEMVRRADADVLALQEVGSVEALRAVLHASGCGYGEPHVARADKRGIACAIATRRPVLEASALDATELPFPALHAGDPAPYAGRLRLRRAIPVVRLDGGELGALTVLSLHWKSARPAPLVLADGTEHEPTTATERAEANLRSLIQRAAEALFLRRSIDAFHAARPDDGIVVGGDFNDVDGSVPLAIARGDAEGEQALVDAVHRVPVAERVSVLHGGTPAAIDHVLLSLRLAKHVQDARFLNDGLLDPDHLPPGKRCLPSDHAPFVVKIAYAPASPG